jgi:MarR-like DNA-binding transcriptional regulator SgrR of sgrS sRNA
MRHPIFTSLALASLLLTVDVSGARPRYGGTLRIAAEGTLRTLDPGVRPTVAADALLADRVLPLVFETLINVDPDGGLDAGVAETWERDAGSRWRIRLRSGVVRHDGTAVDAGSVVAILRATFPNWEISAAAGAILIDATGGPADVPWALTERASALAWRLPTGDWIGTGPFRVGRLEPTRLALDAFERHWQGRPFVDQVQVTMGRDGAARRADVDAGRTDMTWIAPGDARRFVQRGLRVVGSRPNSLLALVFEPERAINADERVRLGLAEAFDREAIARALLQGHAEPAYALLPDWVSGYHHTLLNRRSALIPSRAEIMKLPLERRTLVLRVNATDGLAQTIAQRLVVDADAAGFRMTVQVPTAALAPRADLRLVRIPIGATSPERALGGVMMALGTRTLALTTRTLPAPGAPLEEVVSVESSLLDRQVVVPLVHVRELSVLGDRVAADVAAVTATGVWKVADMWLNDPASAP